MKKLALTTLLAMVLSFSVSMIAFAHSGGLDQDGGHYDHKTGQYHYHRR